MHTPYLIQNLHFFFMQNSIDRISGCTKALQNGEDIKTVSGMLGQFTLGTYAHVTTSAQKEAAQTMGNLLSMQIRLFYQFNTLLNMWQTAQIGPYVRTGCFKNMDTVPPYWGTYDTYHFLEARILDRN